MTKTCDKCVLEKPLTAFYKQSRGTTHWHTCKDCVAVERKSSGADREKKYGLPLNEYNLMVFAHGGVCAICGHKEKAKGKGGVDKGLAVDHNHRCCPAGKACVKCRRGLLCYKCNQGLGAFKDDVAVLRKALTYLETWTDSQGI